MTNGLSLLNRLSSVAAFAIVTGVFIPSLHSQTSASDWFQKGLDATAVDDRIDAFERSTQLDPNYVEAYFYLGLAYKTKGLYPEAEVALNKAYFTNPYALNNDIKTRILFELGTLHATVGNIERAREALKGAKDLANNRALKGRIAYELGQIYMLRGQFAQAVIELEQGRDLWPQNAREFDRLLREATDKKSLNEVYHRGLSYFNNERYEQALAAFNEVIQSDPSFREVQAKVREAKTALQANRQSRNTNALYDRAAKLAQEKNWQEAIKLLEQIVKADANFRDAQARLQRLRDLADNAVQEDELERTYQNGVAALRSQNWRQALNHFASVQNIDPGYKDVARLVRQVKQGRSRAQARESQLTELYEQGTAQMAAKRWDQALASFKELETLSPGFRDIEAQLISIRHALTQQSTAVDTLYRDGLFALQNGDWLQAVLAFEKVKLLDPDYENINNKLADAQFNLQKNNNQSQISQESGSNVFLWIGATLSVLLLPVAGALIFSPTTRARLYLLQGNYAKAAENYEKSLDKKPEKVKLYPVLANLYLLEDRRDKQAIKIFEMVLKLHLLTPKRAEINSIVANYYLTEGRTDGNAIAIMERELSNKIKKLQSGAAS
ncbi:MAG: tetratricopeptide repeat protein [bacterium]